MGVTRISSETKKTGNEAVSFGTFQNPLEPLSLSANAEKGSDGCGLGWLVGLEDGLRSRDWFQRFFLLFLFLIFCFYF